MKDPVHKLFCLSCKLVLVLFITKDYLTAGYRPLGSALRGSRSKRKKPVFTQGFPKIVKNRENAERLGQRARSKGSNPALPVCQLRKLNLSAPGEVLRVRFS